MSFADPTSITVTYLNGGVAMSLPRVVDSPLASTYRSADESVEVIVSHQNVGKAGALNERRRRTVRLNVRTVAASPLDASVSTYQSASVYVVVDQPVYGFTTTQLSNMATGLFSLLTASSNLALLKLLGGEH